MGQSVDPLLVGVEHCVGLRLGQLLSGFPFCVSWLRIRAHRRELSRAASATGAADANLRVVRLCNKHHIRDADLSDQRRNGCQRDAAIQARSRSRTNSLDAERREDVG